MEDRHLGHELPLVVGGRWIGPTARAVSPVSLARGSDCWRARSLTLRRLGDG